MSSARDEAHRLGHPHVGTEHLLLGLLAESGTSAWDALIAAGATLVSAREKVVEALASRTTSLPPRSTQDLQFTDRASRALDRASRLSLRAGSDYVNCEHILLSVLDVEGTAGQVLRGLAVDPDAVRQALTSPPSSPATLASPAPPPPTSARPEATGPRCGTCGSPLATSLNRWTLAAGSGESMTQVEVFYCTVCGTALGVESS